MKVDGKHFRSIWLAADGWSVSAIDQRRLPHEFVIARLTNCTEAADAIRSMLVRGAPLIGATAAYGMALAVRDDKSDAAIERAYQMLIATPELPMRAPTTSPRKTSPSTRASPGTASR
jgi:methylthioribose-1-phosphate isomerase